MGPIGAMGVFGDILNSDRVKACLQIWVAKRSGLRTTRKDSERDLNVAHARDGKSAHRDRADDACRENDKPLRMR